jgi:transcriptional regulator with XRE-family HTH domain
MSTVISNQKAMENVAENFRNHLDGSGMSLREVARKTGDPPMTLSNILNGKNLPGVALLARIAEAFGVTIDSFLEDPKKILTGR